MRKALQLSISAATVTTVRRTKNSTGNAEHHFGRTCSAKYHSPPLLGVSIVDTPFSITTRLTSFATSIQNGAYASFYSSVVFRTRYVHVFTSAPFPNYVVPVTRWIGRAEKLHEFIGPPTEVILKPM